MSKDLYVIGLTGPSGAGKGAVAGLLAQRSIPVIDADRVYHELLIPPSPCLDALTEEFSSAILSDDGTLDRRALSTIVFEDSESGRKKLEVLNHIAHHFVTEKTIALLSQYRAEKKRAAVIDAPLLLEAGMERLCDYTIAVLADKQTRLARLIARDRRSEKDILARMAAQPDDDFYRTRVDTVLYNNDDLAALSTAVDDLCKRLEVCS